MRHLYIPDTQVKPGVCVNHLNALGNYIVDKKFERIIMAGDWADMHSLSSYDLGRKSGEGARYMDDLGSSYEAMTVLFEPIWNYNDQQRKNKKATYQPSYDLTLGNHENRINRHVEAHPILEHALSVDSLAYEDFGWNVHEFLKVLEHEGILYSHYFPRNANGRVVQSIRGAPSAAMQVRREMQSATSGHLQGLDFHVQQTGKRRYYGIIAGSFYMHEEKYMTPQGEAYWRGVIVKNQVNNGEYDPMFISLDYLLRNYWDGVDRYV